MERSEANIRQRGLEKTPKLIPTTLWMNVTKCPRHGQLTHQLRCRGCDLETEFCSEPGYTIDPCRIV